MLDQSSQFRRVLRRVTQFPAMSFHVCKWPLMAALPYAQVMFWFSGGAFCYISLGRETKCLSVVDGGKKKISQRESWSVMWNQGLDLMWSGMWGVDDWENLLIWNWITRGMTLFNGPTHEMHLLPVGHIIQSDQSHNSNLFQRPSIWRVLIEQWGKTVLKIKTRTYQLLG